MLQIDLRYANAEEGGLEVVVAPVMRFKDIDFNANVKIEDIAPPDRIISGFALEIFGAPLAVCISLEAKQAVRRQTLNDAAADMCSVSFESMLMQASRLHV